VNFDPPSQGWLPVQSSPFGALIGPMWRRQAEDGANSLGFVAAAHHANPGGVIHGGMLMAFADEFLGGMVFLAVGRQRIVTIQLNTHFIGAVRVGDFVEATGEILRRTRSLAFVRGIIAVGDTTIAAIDGIWKVLATE
jgi:uncharacterized protein (TIGR00369 family)